MPRRRRRTLEQRGTLGTGRFPGGGFNQGMHPGRGRLTKGQPARPRLYGDPTRLQRVLMPSTGKVLTISATVAYRLRYGTRWHPAHRPKVLRGPLPAGVRAESKPTVIRKRYGRVVR